MINPLGKITVAAAGTPVQVTANTGIRGNAITIQALTTNTGNVYVGGAGLVKATLVNAAAALTPGQFITLSSYNGLTMDPSTVYLDADTNGNGALVVVT